MKSAVDLVKEHLLYMTTDLIKWRGLLHETAIWEFAFAPSTGAPREARGIAEIAQRVERFVARVEGLIFDDLKIYEISGEDAVFAEFQGRAKVTATGRPYQQHYVLYLCAKDGKIVFAREYFDPARVVAAFS